MPDSDPEDQAREQINETEQAEARDRASGMASLFDLRVVIGGLLTLYGVILTVMGLFASDDAKAKPPASTSTSGPAWSSWPAGPSSSPGPGSAPCDPRTSRPPTTTAPRPNRAAGSVALAVKRSERSLTAGATSTGPSTSSGRSSTSSFPSRRDTKAAHRFFGRAIGATKIAPAEVTTDQAPLYPAVLKTGSSCLP